MVKIHVQLTVSIVLWIIITVTFLRILSKMSCVIIYRHNQLKSLSWIDFSCVFNVGLWSLIHYASFIIMKIFINNFKVYGVDILMWLLYAMVANLRCVVSAIMIFYSLCYSPSTFSHIIVNASWFRTFPMIN